MIEINWDEFYWIKLTGIACYSPAVEFLEFWNFLGWNGFVVVSMVSWTGTLVNKLSTSKEASLPVVGVACNMLINSYVEFTINFPGMYFTIMLFN